MRMKSMFQALGAFACAFAISFYYEWRLTLGTGSIRPIFHDFLVDFELKWIKNPFQSLLCVCPPYGDNNDNNDESVHWRSCRQGIFGF